MVICLELALLGQLVEGASAVGIILPKKEHGGIVNNALCPTLLNVLAVGLEVFLPSLEVATRTTDSLEVTHISLEQKGLESGQVVEEETDYHHAR